MDQRAADLARGANTAVKGAKPSVADDEPWELFYWAQMQPNGRNHMIGRGEFVRLLFEAAGVEYIDHGVLSGGAAVANFLWGPDEFLKKFPLFAPPAIRHGSFVLFQTPAICLIPGQAIRVLSVHGRRHRTR